MEKSKNVHIWLYSVLIAGLIGAVIWAVMAQKNARALSTTVENQYNRAFHELVDYIDDIDTLLTKAQLANSPAQLASISSDIFRQSAEAKSCLGQLPTSDVQLDNTAKFLSQVGDYTYVLSQDMINGTALSDEEYKNLISLNEYASSLKESLAEIQSSIYSGDIKFSDVGKKKSNNTVNAAGNDIITDLENVEKSFEEYPSLIYDGPFSEHIENQQSAMLENAKEISRDEALKRAADFLGNQGDGLTFESESENTAIAAYTFTKTTENDEQISISVTKKGGNILYYLKNTRVNNENFDLPAATEEAQKFLEQHGFENMVSSYYEKANGIATVNFASSQGDIVCYSDLVKVRVALDTGEIIGIETKGYLMNHKTRDLSAPSISLEEAKEHVSTQLEVTATKLALVPKDSLKEVLCYEFKGTFNGKNFIVYVNADNGREEEILMLIENEGGVLTI
jgi:germination protein YpeB